MTATSEGRPPLRPSSARWPTLARERPQDSRWLFHQLDKRFGIFIEAAIDVLIGYLERDCMGLTRSEFLLKEPKIDGASGVVRPVGGPPSPPPEGRGYSTVSLNAPQSGHLKTRFCT